MPPVLPKALAAWRLVEASFGAEGNPPSVSEGVSLRGVFLGISKVFWCFLEFSRCFLGVV